MNLYLVKLENLPKNNYKLADESQKQDVKIATITRQLNIFGKVQLKGDNQIFTNKFKAVAKRKVRTANGSVRVIPGKLETTAMVLTDRNG